MLPQIELPKYFDSSMLAVAAVCKRKFYWQHLLKRKPIATSIHLLAGGAFAAGIEAARRVFYVDQQEEEVALHCGILAILQHWGTNDPQSDQDKSRYRTCLALLSYLEAYPLGDTHATVPYTTTSGRKMIEFSFAHPLDVNHPITGDPILYCGRTDMIGLYQGDQPFIVDEKTTSRLGVSWSKKWARRGQFTGYVWSARQFKIPVLGTLVRGISFLSNLKNEHQEALVTTDTWEIDEWKQGVESMIQGLIEDWRQGHFPKDPTGEGCVKYSACPYSLLCGSRTPETWLEGYYEIDEWTPLRKIEEKVND